jgi:homocitrate synthase NifV
MFTPMAARTDKRRVCLIDTTLRDGAQAPGVRFDPAQQQKIARSLDAMGIDALEVGTPAMGPAAEDAIRSIVALGLTCQLSGWCRARVDDLVAAERCGLQWVHISLPVSDIHLDALGKRRQWVIDQLEALIPPALQQFRRVTIGAQDATRAEPGWLTAFAKTAARMGAHGLRVADTVGIGRPASVAESIAALKKAVPGLPLEFHGHNDLGMATANALTAAEAGAEALSVTVNGLGERAGNVALEQIIMAIQQHPQLTCHARCENLLAVCRLVAGAGQRPIAPDRPVVGGLVFTHESGIHCHAMLKNPATYEPFAPQCIGRNGSRFTLGSHSGRAGIRHLLARAGIRAANHQVNCLARILGDGSFSIEERDFEAFANRMVEPAILPDRTA